MEVVYGLDFKVDDNEMAKESYEYIAKDITNIKENYIKLGFHLHECETCSYYKDFGYASFSDFVYDNFGLDKSALSKCINVFRRFSVCENNCHKMFLQDDFSEYSYSQLCEMLPLSKVELLKVNPDMTVKQIRDYKKSLKNKVSMSQPLHIEENINDDVDDVEVVQSYSSITDDFFIFDLLQSAKGFIESNFSADYILSIGVTGKRLTVETENEICNLQFSRTRKKGE